MVEIRQTAVFTKWIRGLADQRASLAIAKRIDRLASVTRRLREAE